MALSRSFESDWATEWRDGCICAFSMFHFTVALTLSKKNSGRTHQPRSDDEASGSDGVGPLFDGFVLHHDLDDLRDDQEHNSEVTKRLAWLEQDLANVDRSITP
ncbi:hypothetical protein C1H46_010759 [Malus baccata]|uniref:Uncharacterized protein n=1 Tax=Malus baccata TaxID=106549 RepID=A0A540MXX6_MALBA|nr:hypothetical protein C1H46_010759 [Malus baccata]